MLSGCCWDLVVGFAFGFGCGFGRVAWCCGGFPGLSFWMVYGWGLRYSTGVWGLLALVSGLGDFQVCVLVCYFRFCGL